MNKINVLWLALALLLAAGAAAGQTPTPSPSAGGAPRTVVRSDRGVAPVIPWMFEPIVTGGLLDGLFVSNKPLAAVLESETVRLQASGAPVVRRVTTRIYRDNEGRTRREQIFHQPGATPSPGQAAQTITVSDPVARWGYSINAARQIASSYRLPTTPVTGAPFNNQIPLITRILRNANPQTGMVTSYPLEPPLVQLLGRETVAGVEAEKVRVTIRVPAGALGNANMIETIYETWISLELQMLVKCVVSNPVSGTYTLLLTSISRTQQPRSLFEVPAGYQVSEMGVRRTNVAPPH